MLLRTISMVAKTRRGRGKGRAWRSHRETPETLCRWIMTFVKESCFFAARRTILPTILLISAREVGSCNPGGTGGRVCDSGSLSVGC
jgi:hypothetical protein